MLKAWQIREAQENLPGFKVLVSFEAALPIYEAWVEVRLLRKQDISPLERMVLACVPIGVSSVEAMEIVLGVPRALVRNAVAALMGVDLVTVRDSAGSQDKKQCVLTDRGSEAVVTNALHVPMPYTLKVLFDGMLGCLSPLLRYQYVNRKDVEVRGLHVLPAAHKEPTTTDLEHDGLRRYMKELARIDPKRSPQGELHDILRVTTVVKQYRPVDVLALDADDGSEVAFRVFEGGQVLRDYGEKLGVMFRKVPEVLPLVRRSEEEIALEGASAEVPLLETALMQQAHGIQQEFEELGKALASADDHDDQVGGPDSEPGPAAVTESPEPSGQRTRAELAALKVRYAELEAKLASLRPVNSREQAALFEKALTASRKRVIIVSPWLTRDVIDQPFLDRIEKALRRGVDILVCYGMPQRAQPSEDENRKERQTERLAERLKLFRRIGTRGAIRVVRLGNTHEKILVVDSRFAVISSFNFLSFRGDPSRGFREETGYYHEIPEKVNELAEQILRRAKRAEDRVGGEGGH